MIEKQCFSHSIDEGLLFHRIESVHRPDFSCTRSDRSLFLAGRNWSPPAPHDSRRGYDESHCWNLSRLKGPVGGRCAWSPLHSVNRRNLPEMESIARIYLLNTDDRWEATEQTNVFLQTLVKIAKTFGCLQAKQLRWLVPSKRWLKTNVSLPKPRRASLFTSAMKRYQRSPLTLVLYRSAIPLYEPLIFKIEFERSLFPIRAERNDFVQHAQSSYPVSMYRRAQRHELWKRVHWLGEYLVRRLRCAVPSTWWYLG